MLLEHPKANIKTLKYENTALIIATIKDDKDIAQLLLQHPNTNVNLQTKSGKTALMIATKKGYTDIIKLIGKHIKTKKN